MGTRSWKAPARRSARSHRGHPGRAQTLRLPRMERSSEWPAGSGPWDSTLWVGPASPWALALPFSRFPTHFSRSWSVRAGYQNSRAHTRVKALARRGTGLWVSAVSFTRICIPEHYGTLVALGPSSRVLCCTPGSLSAPHSFLRGTPLSWPESTGHGPSNPRDRTGISFMLLGVRLTLVFVLNPSSLSMAT
jgi:hypothetical protein